MYLGKIVELGPSAEIYENPRHPYTISLLNAFPKPDPSRSPPRDVPRGEVPDAVSPPLGCAFHPRCPRAFEVCGWESRDLRAMLERHWTRLREEDYETERAMIGDLAVLDVSATVARLQSAPGHSGEATAKILERLRGEAPEDPFWKGVAAIETERGEVRVHFHEGIVPREVQAGAARLRCHLHDEQALDRARRAGASDGR